MSLSSFNPAWALEYPHHFVKGVYSIFSVWPMVPKSKTHYLKYKYLPSVIDDKGIWYVPRRSLLKKKPIRPSFWLVSTRPTYTLTQSPLKRFKTKKAAVAYATQAAKEEKLNELLDS